MANAELLIKKVKIREDEIIIPGRLLASHRDGIYSLPLIFFFFFSFFLPFFFLLSLSSLLVPREFPFLSRFSFNLLRLICSLPSPMSIEQFVNWICFITKKYNFFCGVVLRNGRSSGQRSNVRDYCFATNLERTWFLCVSSFNTPFLSFRIP